MLTNIKETEKHKKALIFSRCNPIYIVGISSKGLCMKTDKIIEKLKNFKTWLYGLGLGGIAIGLWWVIKIVICATTGICLIF